MNAPTAGVAPQAAPCRTLTLRKAGTILEVSVNGEPDPSAALPEEARRLLEPLLQYQHKRLLYGPERTCPVTNATRQVEITDKQLYRYDGYGRMVTNLGFGRRVLATLQQAGYQVRQVEKKLPREQKRDEQRPNAYDFDPNRVAAKFAFRERQAECLQAIAACRNGVVHAVTGFGKLVLLAMTCVGFHRAKTHVVVKRTQLARKIYNYLARYVPDVGLVGDGSKEFGRRVTVITGASLHLATPWDADLLLCDEAHELLAEQASSFLVRYEYTRNIAFTATPEGRSDGADVRMEALFGQTIFHLPYWEAVSLGLAAPIRVEWHDVFMDHNPGAGKSAISKKRWGLWRNAHRNQVLADAAARFGPDEQVMILVDTIEHAVFLRQHALLDGYTLVFGPSEFDRKDMYLRKEMASPEELDMPPKRLHQLREEFEAGRLKKVIATGVWSVGIDPVQLAAVGRGSSTPAPSAWRRSG